MGRTNRGRSRVDSRGSSRRGGEPKSLPQVEWLSGLHVVGEALEAGRRRLDRLWLRKDSAGNERLEALVALAEGRGLPVETVDPERFAGARDDLDRESNDQGVKLAAGPLPELSLRDLVARSGEPGARTLVALDGVEDPQNVGALARVADAAGAAGLILTRRRSPPLSPALSRASAGAIEWLPVARIGNLDRGLEDLQKAGFWVIGADPEGTGGLFDLEDRQLSGDLVVVLGAEGRGLRRTTRERLDFGVRIPMRGRVASLNVATAGAVFLFEILRRRSAAAPRSRR